jgi:ABC-2 type transport system permease protein
MMTQTMTKNSLTAAAPVGGVRKLIRDTHLVMTRELRPVLRDPFSVIFGMIQPLIFLARRAGAEHRR